MADEPLKALTLVAFDVGAVTYAIEIGSVREIIRAQTMERIPDANEGVVGVFDHRGDVVPLIDLRTRLRAVESPATRETRWILVDNQGQLSGLVVDRVHEVFSAEPELARKLPPLTFGAAHGGIQAAYSQRGRLVFVVTVSALVSLDPQLLSLPPQVTAQSEVR